jgi:L-threonylcarbamoyladenylate synthase
LKIDTQLIERAAALIREGRLVAFPTETVYGLGANALDVEAVRRIFEAKGRPSTDPLIVHVNSIEMARGIVAEWPAEAELLARHWWPGPLTLVLRKQPSIPALVTAGLNTVGVRFPRHPVAQALIRAAGLPIAAPSANPFMQLSPTTAEHVRQTLGDRVDLVLDGGPTEVGIESTVLSLVDGQARLLRPGMVSRQQIEALIGGIAVGATDLRQSPGQHSRHYSPSTRLLLVEDAAGLPGSGRGAYVYRERPAGAARVVAMPNDAVGYAASLYAVLHELDGQGWDWIAVEKPPAGPEWAGVNDRLDRAAR